MGPVGSKGDLGLKGQKGDRGPAGMPGTKGEPGESISAPVVSVFPAKLTVNESGTASFQCSVSGNPEPAIVWSKRDNLSEVSKSAISRGRLLLKNVNESDSGEYQCSATNILGHAQTVVQLVVNGGFLYRILFSKVSRQNGLRAHLSRLVSFVFFFFRLQTSSDHAANSNNKHFAKENRTATIITKTLESKKAIYVSRK